MVGHWPKKRYRRFDRKSSILISDRWNKNVTIKYIRSYNYVNIQRYDEGNARRCKLAKRGVNTRNVNVIISCVRVPGGVPRWRTVLEHSKHQFIPVFSPLAILIREIHRKGERNTNGIICSFRRRRIETFYCCFDVIGRRWLKRGWVAFRRSRNDTSTIFDLVC